MNMKTGLVCGLTDEKPTFEDTCPNYNEDSEAKTENERKRLELEESKKEVSGITALFLYASVGLGLVITIVSAWATISSLGIGNLVSIYILVYTLMFAYVGISAIIGFHRHWSNSVSLAYTYCAMLAADSIPALMFGYGSIKNLVLAIAYSAFFYFSEDIRFNYPKEFRTWKLPEKIFLGVQIAMSLLIIVGNSV